MRRARMTRRANRKSFRRGTKVSNRNSNAVPMRGGFRL